MLCTRVPDASHLVMSACAAASSGGGSANSTSERTVMHFSISSRTGSDRRAVAVGGVDRDGRVQRHQLQRGREVAAEIDVDHAVDAAVLGERHHLGDDVLGPVVDDHVGAGQPRLHVLDLRAHGRDHLRAAPLRQLHGIVADRAGAAGDQHRLARDRTRRANSAHHAVMQGMPSVAPAANDTSCGSGVTR